jgi:hypothetical protein
MILTGLLWARFVLLGAIAAVAALLVWAAVTDRERAGASEPRERSGDHGVPASERVRGLRTKSPDQVG